MKKHVFLFLISLFSLVSFAQKTTKDKINSARVYYNVEKIFPPNQLKKIETSFFSKESVRETVMGSYLKTKPVTSILEFKNTISYYVLSDEDLNELNDARYMSFNLSSTLAASSNKYYIDLNSNGRFFKAKNMQMEYELIYFEQPKWKIFEETKSILGYKCKKALKVDSYKSKTYVWFTEEIPYGFGPKTFFGLPGLILEIEKGNNVFVAKKIEINPKDIKIVKPKANLKTTTKEKEKIFSKIFDEN